MRKKKNGELSTFDFGFFRDLLKLNYFKKKKSMIPAKTLQLCASTLMIYDGKC